MIRDFKRIARPELDPGTFVAQLRDVIRRGQHDLVIPADDQALVALVEHYHRFQDLTEIACPPPDITRFVLDKSLTLEAAQRCGIRIPKTRLISNSEQLREVFSTFAFPRVLKPARKEMTVEEIKSCSFKTPEEVVAKYPKSKEFAQPMLLQEYCEGAGVAVELLMHGGNCLAAFQHRRIEEAPYTGGVSVTAVSQSPDPSLVKQSIDLLRALLWQGPAMVEFKVNTLDNSAVLMEVNGRYWGTISLAVLAGIDFPLYHWQILHGETPTVPQKYDVGIKWRWTAGLILRLHGLLVLARRSRSAREELMRSFSECPTLLNGAMRDAIFSTADPMPAALDLVQVLRYLSSYHLGALLRRLPRDMAS